MIYQIKQFFIGFLIGGTNPKVILFYLSVIPLFLDLTNINLITGIQIIITVICCIDNNITSVISSEINEIDSVRSSLNESKSNQHNKEEEIITINEIDLPQAISPITTIINKDKEEYKAPNDINFIGALEGFIVLILICMIATGLSRIFKTD